jgi:hypothetical protein
MQCEEVWDKEKPVNSTVNKEPIYLQLLETGARATVPLYLGYLSAFPLSLSLSLSYLYSLVKII